MSKVVRRGFAPKDTIEFGDTHRERMQAAGKDVQYLLDEPVSNSGRLKTLLYEMAEKEEFTLNVELLRGVDTCLEQKAHVVTSDAIILDRCKSWCNLTAKIIREQIPDAILYSI